MFCSSIPILFHISTKGSDDVKEGVVGGVPRKAGGVWAEMLREEILVVKPTQLPLAAIAQDGHDGVTGSDLARELSDKRERDRERGRERERKRRRTKASKGRSPT